MVQIVELGSILLRLPQHVGGWVGRRSSISSGVGVGEVSLGPCSWMLSLLPRMNVLLFSCSSYLIAFKGHLERFARWVVNTGKVFLNWEVRRLFHGADGVRLLFILERLWSTLVSTRWRLGLCLVQTPLRPLTLHLLAFPTLTTRFARTFPLFIQTAPLTLSAIIEIAAIHNGKLIHGVRDAIHANSLIIMHHPHLPQILLPRALSIAQGLRGENICIVAETSGAVEGVTKVVLKLDIHGLHFGVSLLLNAIVSGFLLLLVHCH